MYHPFFRGKQFELITIRENAALMADAGFIPIIEPVKLSVGGLVKSLDAVRDAGGKAMVIVNPQYGDHAVEGDGIIEILRDVYKNYHDISPAVLLRSNDSVSEIVACIENTERRGSLALIHKGFSQANELLSEIGTSLSHTHVFFEKDCGKLYMRKFPQDDRILLRDGFRRMRNSDYPQEEHFSDLHVTFKDEGVAGFGDFLIVGDDYNEAGGPAYAVAIHLTYIDETRDSQMFIRHFVSHRRDTPTDPAGKFVEALDQMVGWLDDRPTKIPDTPAVQEFRSLHRREHYPGLGYVKKLSMAHHIQVMAHYFKMADAA